MAAITAASGHVIMHPVVSKSLKIWATTLGRDKTYRAIQYFARFYVYILLRNGQKEKAQYWNALKNHLGLGRKLMRLGKPLEHLQAALKAAQSPSLSLHTAERLTSVGRQLCYAGYLTFDGLVWANTIKFVNFVPEKADRVLKISLRFWLVGILFGQANSLLKAGRLANEAKALKGVNEKSMGDRAANDTRLKVLEKERAAVRYQLLLDLLDMWIPATGLGVVNFNDAVVGLLGFTTSVMAFRSQWNSLQMG
ncbi:related to peroxin-11 [Serendipita indica DSM 11827]|uniref:Related to peroxin-11 n=1 Tax=Serendipita indica (strain DSM 11827) TaxID=1109443 RepID=G4T983_SERID|nr:related to peroxin-11 [Serendipita indica DSM 11827]